MDISELQRLEPGKSINRHPWEIARAKIAAFLLKRNQKNYRHIADIGSGDAYVLSKMAQQQLATNYSAIDTAYTTDILVRLQPITDPDIKFYTDSRQLENTESKPDCLLFMDVLEHCKDDKDVLEMVVHSNYVGEDVTVMITVPAFQSLFSKHDELLQHYRRYNRNQVKKLAVQCGLEVVTSGYFFGSLLPIRVFQLFLEKIGLRKPVSSLDNWKAGKLISSLFITILWFNFRVSDLFNRIGIRLPGLSCYCICRKQR